MEILNEYILLEIFQNLDKNDLLTSTLVCKGWNRVISYSSATMKKMNLRIRHERAAQLTKAPATEIQVTLYRRYKWIEFCKFRITEKIYDLLKSQVFVCKLDLYKMTLSESVYLKLLRNLTLMENLTIEHSKIILRSHMKSKAVRMPNLESISVDESPLLFLAFIDGLKVKNLKISKGKGNKFKNDSIGDFVQTLSSLEHLSLDVRTDHIFNVFTNDGCQLALKKLKVLPWSEEQSREIIKFLATQKQTLENLSIDTRRCRNISCIYEFALLHMDIKSLVLDPKHLPRDELFYDKKETKLIKLELLPHTNIAKKAAKKLFKMCSGIKHVKFIDSELTNPLLQLLSSALPDLNRLDLIRSFKSDGNFELKFNSLQYLTLDDTLTRYCCPNRTHILSVPELRELTLYSKKFLLSQKFMDALKTKCPQLHTLNLLKTKATYKFLSEHPEDNIRIHLRQLRHGYWRQSQGETLEIKFI